MMTLALSLLCVAVMMGPGDGGAVPGERPSIADGVWRAWLDLESSPDGELPFQIRIRHPLTDDRPAGIAAWLVNGTEEIEIPVVRWEGDELLLSMDYYDAHLRARVRADGRRMDGVYTKQRSAGPVSMGFHAEAGEGGTEGARFRSNRERVLQSTQALRGKWRVTFEGGEEGVLVLDGTAERTTGTILTTTGDYRYFAGDFPGEGLRLSAFDGAHAFLVHARLLEDGGIRGEFWSGDWHHETFEGKRDDDAELRDGFSFTKAIGTGNVNGLKYVDMQGSERSLSEESLGGNSKARIVYVFGTWCPNCKDATAFLNELRATHKGRDFEVVGLAFEVTGDKERDLKQVRTYVERAGVEFPVLLAGVAEKKKAAEALPVIDAVKAYPTLLFVDGKGRIRAAYAGFSGPATGEEHEKLKKRMTGMVERLLGE